MKRKYFGTNGIRGEFGELITPNFIAKMSLAIASLIESKGTVVVGSDSRTSSPLIKHIVMSNLIASGIEVIDLGMVPTPLVQFAVTHLHANLGIVITASHNPPQYNGIKVIDADGIEIDIEKQLEIEDKYEREISRIVEWNEITNITQLNLIPEYVEQIVSFANEAIIRKKNLSVVIDGGNSVGGEVTALALKILGVRAISINSQLDGNFPGRSVEPIPEKLGEMGKIVVNAKADFSVAHDGDGDRSIFGDEKGKIYYGDRSIAIFEKWILCNEENRNFVTPISSSRVVEDLAKELGGKIIWTPVGCVYVSRTMIQNNCLLGGEENGGLFYAPHQSVRDGVMASVLMANILAETNRTLSELEKELPKYYQRKEKIHCSNSSKERVLNHIVNNIVEEVDLITIDGVKLVYSDGWVLIRPSGTEPIFRIFTEADTAKNAEEKMKKAKILVVQALDKYN